jgi:hypothetical protein
MSFGATCSCQRSREAEVAYSTVRYRAAAAAQRLTAKLAHTVLVLAAIALLSGAPPRAMALPRQPWNSETLVVR